MGLGHVLVRRDMARALRAAHMLSWLRRNQRLMAHYEAFAFIAEGFAKLAMICVMLKRLTEPKPMSAT